MLKSSPSLREQNVRTAARQTVENAELAANRGKRVAIFIVAYNAVTTLAKVLARIPKVVYDNVEEVVIFDDASPDATYALAIGLQKTLGNDKLHVLRHEKNLGYGGNQKAGYTYLIEKGFDAVVLLHGDGQYAPEFLAQMYHPLVTGEAEAVFGSRMMSDHGGPLKGGMPMYKYAGNRVLTELSNFVLDMNLTEFHSGYRAYSLHALKQIDFTHMTNDFHFDTEIIVKLHHQGFRITERAIPTYYGDEICHVNGMKYAKNVARSLWRYKRTTHSIKSYAEYQEYFVHYPLKDSKNSSHELFRRLAGRDGRVLDLGCGEGYMAEHLAAANNKMTGIDILEEPKLREVFEEYYCCPLDQGLGPVLPQFKGKTFDKILCMDILEHLTNPEKLLKDIHPLCQPNTQVVISVPNVANITVRLALLFGQFNYTARGILDKTHLKFWTRGTIKQLLRDNGFDIIKTRMTVMPIELALGLSSNNWFAVILNRLLGAVTWLMPGLFGYQTVIVARSVDSGSDVLPIMLEEAKPVSTAQAVKAPESIAASTATSTVRPATT